MARRGPEARSPARSSTYATGPGPAAAACAICAACRAPTNGDTTTGNKQGVRLMTLSAGCMRIAPERALRTPPSFSMEGPALGDPHTPLPWLLPPPPTQRGGWRGGARRAVTRTRSGVVARGRGRRRLPLRGCPCVMKSVNFVDAPFWADVSLIETLFDICVVN